MRQRLLISVVLAMAAAGWYSVYRVTAFTITVAEELERARDLASLTPRAQTTIVMDREGKPAFAFYAEQRIDVPLERVSRHMLDAVIAIEDRRFYFHYGVDPVRIAGAALKNLRAGRVLEGGSTITQQLARAAHLSPARTFERKLREALLALTLEERYTKAQILREYLNTVYFGDGYYGVEAASRGYFGKPATDLEVPEAALLAALVRAPSNDAPSQSPERATRRRNLVLRLMRDQGRISDAEYASSVKAALPSVGGRGDALLMVSNAGNGGYFQEEVRRQLVTMFGAERVLRGGLRVHSTYDPRLQQAAEEAIRSRIAEIAKSRKRARDLQGSLVAIDPASGEVLALVGGRSFEESPFNRATQARRQAGSAFKPIIYAAALERGYAPGSMLRDLETPIYSSGKAWLPIGEHERDEYTLRKALALSSNRAAAQLLQQVGVGTAVDYAHRLGIESDLPMVPSLALGTGEVTLLQLTSAYGVFAHQGVRAAPHFITRVDDAQGRTIWRASIETTRAISPTTAFLMSSMLSDVISAGTATGARAAGFTLPAGGKTGTTDDYADAWFVGYTPRLVAGVWFGLDTPAPIMDRGFAGVVAVPAWARFMRAATKGAKAEWFETPANVERVAICRLSGARATDACRNAASVATEPGVEVMHGSVPELIPVAALPTKPAEPNVYEDYFILGTAPADYCPIHGAVAALADASTLSDIVRASLTTAPRPPVVIERVPRADGTTAITLKGGGDH
jgi:penicillin-binding protein 1A